MTGHNLKNALITMQNKPMSVFRLNVVRKIQQNCILYSNVDYLPNKFEELK